MSADPIRAILKWPEADFTPLALAETLGVARQGITEAIRANRIEALAMNLRGGNAQRRYRISKGAAIRWIWANTTGDKASLRSSLERYAPRLLADLEPVVVMATARSKRKEEEPMSLFEAAGVAVDGGTTLAGGLEGAAGDDNQPSETKTQP